ncbi:hypothetical protein CLOSTMETH_02726 [[Clostridium] methylpentosum DSM 5476]|uniref:Uncharacterized protein n=1 Tax=[Clostridium] methylpentosum DSM 5476 TaxID=537013 RepID=C0EFT4_9FIRM|nr:hypothetical protein CLOSTMETH_02726 [[Clostridium] methylpentosum DSM 5476]MDY3989878.1 hypothetical protein [Massilioclostridium sp.]
MKDFIYSFYNITASSIDRYLQFNGWIRNYNFANRNMMVYTSKNNRQKTLAIPASEEFEDFYPILRDVIGLLQKKENRPANNIVKDITTTFIDRLEFRVISEITEDGKIPLEYAADCVEGLKNLILYSVCAEQSARPICYRTTDYAKALLNKFKLAQTEKGSFILNVDIQVVDENNEQIVLEGCDIPTPFEHKVIERIGTAISQVDAIVNNQRQLTEMAETAFENGITANMCDAFLKMRPVSDTDKVTTTIRYASSLTRQTGQIEQIEMRTNHFLVIDELAKIYRDKIAIQDVSLTGIIRSLSKKIDNDRDLKTIRLYTTFEGASRTVTIVLSDEQYRIACNAHRDGLEVSVSGELDMSERYWVMNNVTSFSPIHQNE